MFFPLKTKFSAEVISVLCRGWFHIHGIPQFILSDRGKEFMKVVTAVCEVLRIKQIRTTAYHPQSNGLCESQHKTLTTELRIRSARPSSPEWSTLLTEIAFSINITPSAIADGLSPFNLVFGRKPRMSANDICFPRKVATTLHTNITGVHEQYVKRLASNLQDLRFRALDSTLEQKEFQREAHDARRASATAMRHSLLVKKGAVVCVNQPTRHLKKLTFQWSDPVYFVISAGPNVCAVRSLIDKGGSKGQWPALININRKMLVPYEVQHQFFVGAVVRRQFDRGVYLGKVTYVTEDEGEPLWRVVFPDFDSEDLSLEQLVDSVVYHPLLDIHQDVVPPKVGSYVWFSLDQQPRLGLVTAVDPTLPKPVTVRFLEPSTGARRLSLASFRLVPVEEDGVGSHEQIALAQIRLYFPALLPSGKLPLKTRRELDHTLKL